MGKIACLFPGQGSQSVGMGLELRDKFEAARTTFDTIDKIAGRSLSALCFAGPEEELKRTINTQPTILTVSLAAWKCFQSSGGPRPDFVAGHSLGEFTALVAAEVLTIDEAVRLVAVRAELMENCPKGAMSAILGMAGDELAAICRKVEADLAASGKDLMERCVIVANFNTREQLVISGAPEAVVLAGDLAKKGGAKVIPLPVGGAFHSPLMSKAASQFEKHLASCSFAGSAIPVVQNCDASPSQEGSELKAKLARQMVSSVRWCQTIEYMLAQGVDTFIEIGPGRALSGMVKKIDRQATIFNVSDSPSLEATMSHLGKCLLR